ncbi:MAG TPA: HD domain-containing protein [Methanocorpusculum sp.]|nr:HD domain-containing protein [Methanocorpusculum sp.]
MPHKSIKDPVHGYITVPEDILPFIDSKPLQRLRNIHQMGFAYLVYPGSHHTRFEHSVGTMHLASQLCQHLEFDQYDTLMVCCAAILHDIGHGPYSHTSELFIQGYNTKYSHDDISTQLTQPDLAELLEKNEINPKDIADLVSGHHKYSGIIHGDLDVDRMDYLLRDAYFTGAPYGNFDVQRLINSFERGIYSSDTLVINESGLSSAEALLITRTLMGASVYYHHVCRIAECMFILAAQNHFDSNDLVSIQQFIEMDDLQATTTLLNSSNPITRDLMQRLRTRNLYKRAISVSRDRININNIPRTRDELNKVQESIADQAGVDLNEVILDVPPLLNDIKMGVMVRVHHDLIPFNEIVPIIDMMNSIRKNQWRLSVYSPPELCERVYKASNEVLCINPITKQNKLTE